MPASPRTSPSAQYRVSVRWKTSTAATLERNKALPCGLANLEDPVSIDDVGYWDLVVKGLDQAEGFGGPRPRTEPARLYKTLFEKVPKPV